MSRFFLIILVNLVIFVVPFVSPKRVIIDDPLYDLPKPILNLTDTTVQDIAKFAVAQYNKRLNSTKYSLENVDSGRISHSKLLGDTYSLHIKVSNGTKLEDYLTVVRVNPLKRTKKLLSFFKLGHILRVPPIYKPITDLNSTLVQDIAKFAVKEYNRWANSSAYSLVRVKSGRRREKVSGVYYDLIAEVTNGTVSGDYKARFSFDKVESRRWEPRIPIE